MKLNRGSIKTTTRVLGNVIDGFRTMENSTLLSGSFLEGRLQRFVTGVGRSTANVCGRCWMTLYG